MRITTIRNVSFYHVLYLIQLIGFTLLIISDYINPTITRSLYCLVVFSTPWLIVEYGRKYMYAEKISLVVVPFFLEVILSILFIGSMIYGIRNGAQTVEDLFSWLLLVYIFDAAICALHSIWPIKAFESSLSGHTEFE